MAVGFVQSFLEFKGRTSKKQRGGPHHVVYGSDVCDTVVSTQESDAVLRLADLKKTVQSRHHIILPLCTISRILDREGFTTKKVEQYANDRNTSITKRKRA